jgi:hypothetical protein
MEDKPEVWRFHPVSQSDSDRIVSVHWGQEGGPAIAIKNIRRISARLWVEVELFYDSECIRILEDLENQRRVVVARGWMPAHDSRGKPMFWFETYGD